MVKAGQKSTHHASTLTQTKRECHTHLISILKHAEQLNPATAKNNILASSHYITESFTRNMPNNSRITTRFSLAGAVVQPRNMPFGARTQENKKQMKNSFTSKGMSKDATVIKLMKPKYKKYLIYNKFKYKIQGFKTIGGQNNLWAKLLHRQTQMQITTEISNMLKHTKRKHCWKCTKILIKRSLKSRHILCICKQ